MSLYETQKKKTASALSATITDEELFGAAFQEFCSKWVQTLTGSKQYQLVMIFDPSNPDIAWTDGRIIYVNLGTAWFGFTKVKKTDSTPCSGTFSTNAGTSMTQCCLRRIRVH